MMRCNSAVKAFVVASSLCLTNLAASYKITALKSLTFVRLRASIRFSLRSISVAIFYCMSLRNLSSIYLLYLDTSDELLTSLYLRLVESF